MPGALAGGLEAAGAVAAGVAERLLGAGAAERKSKVRWAALNEIAVAWVLTLPATALLAAPIYYLVEALLRSGGE